MNLALNCCHRALPAGASPLSYATPPAPRRPRSRAANLILLCVALALAVFAAYVILLIQSIPATGGH